MNKAYEEWFGYDRQQMDGKTMTDVLGPDAEAHLKPFVDRALRGEKVTYEADIPYQKGGRRFIRAHYVPDIVDGQVKGFFTMVEDISEKKQAQETIKDSQEAMAAAQRLARIGSWEFDLTNAESVNLNELRWSDQCYRVFGFEPGEIVPTNDLFFSMVHADDRARISETVAKAIEDHSEYSLEHRIVRADGQERVVHELGKAEYDAAGQPLRMLGTVQDITERKKHEEMIRQSNEALIKSNSELEQFAYVSSHDLKEPLRRINSFSQLLAHRYKNKLDAEADQIIHRIDESVTRMQNLIDDLLSYSRVGKTDIKPGPIDLNLVMADVLSDLEHAISESGATIEVEKLPVVICNPREIHQVLQNLLSNGIKFRGEAPPKIHVSCRQEGLYWVICVRDNGIGIPQKYQEQVFRVFQRLHGRDKYPGTGIGLAICKKIIEKNGGTIWVESEAGQGSTFCFTLRAAEES